MRLQTFRKAGAGSVSLFVINPSGRSLVESPLRPSAFTKRGRVTAHKIRGPVRLPRTIVIRERLFPFGVIAINLVPHVAHADRTLIVPILTVELSMIAGEAAHHPQIQFPGGAVESVDRPLSLLEIKSAQRQSSPPLGGKIKFIHGGHTVEVERRAQGTWKFLSIITAHSAGF